MEQERRGIWTDTQYLVHVALADNFNTGTAVQHLFELITSVNSYMQQNPTLIKVPLLQQTSRYIFKIMKCFGIYDDDVVPAIGEATTQNYGDIITPLMNALRKFRDDIKEKANEGPKVMFQLSDELRDDILPYLGIRLEDRGKGQDAIWKLEEKEILINERENKIQEKLKKEEEKRIRAELDLKKKSTPANEWFRTFFGDKYS